MRIVVCSLWLATACSTTENLGFREGTPTFSVREELPDPIDLLVVLDDTTAMVPYIADGPVPATLGATLTTMYNGAPDVRIAVTTTSTGQRRSSSRVPLGFVEHLVKMEDGSLSTNYTGDLGTALGSVMSVGASSTSANRIFESIDRAFDGEFLRADSGLGILIVTATDDQSSEAVATYASKIQASGRRTAAGAMYVDPVVRLPAFLSAFETRQSAALGSDDMAAMYAFSGLFRPQPFAKCVPREASEYISGFRLDCTLITSHRGVERTLTPCDGDPWSEEAPCYALVDDNQCDSGKLLVLGGPFRMYHPAAHAYCDSLPPQNSDQP